MYPLTEFLQTDEREKNPEWANVIISFVRMYMQPLVSYEKARVGMAYTLSVQDMTPIVNLFLEPSALNLNNSRGVTGSRIINHATNQPVTSGSDNFLQQEMRGIDFKSMPVMEKIRNMITAEIKKMGIVLDVKCDDPTATIKRKDDEAFIKEKDVMSAFLSYVYVAMGEAPVKMEEYEDRFGSKVGNGNIKDFDQMALDNKNPSDVRFFLDHFHKLLAETDAESCINEVMSQNEVESVLYELWVTDFIAKKAIACQQHVSKLNGKITYDYITPETINIYGGGRRKDFNDATAKSYEQRITIKELLDRVGDSFDFENEMDVLFQAVYAASNGSIDITGIKTDSKTGWYCETSNNIRYNYDNFMTQMVTFGYMEFLSPTDMEYGKEFDKSIKKEFKGDRKAQSNFKQPPNSKRYQAKSRYEMPTYCSYYLVLSAYQQRLFDFGKVPYHQIEGYNDFNANWTILTYKEIGDPIAIMCAPFIDRINEAAYKFAYEIRRAKPRGVAYNYDSLLAIAEETFTDTDITRADKLQRVISWFDSSANIVWKYPERDGKIVPISNQQLNIEMPNGLTDGIMKWWEVMEKWWTKMLSVVGLDAPLRQGEPGNARDSMNNQFKALEYSQNNTYYIPDGITYMTQMLATRTMLYIQDIIHFKDYDTMAFNRLVEAVGEDTLLGIAQLGKKAMHRYGVFVESLNQAPQRAKLQARLDMAIQAGKITNAEALLIDEIKSPKKQFIVLAYFEQRAAQIAQKNAMELQQAQAQQAKELQSGEKELLLLKGDIDLRLQQVTNHGLAVAHSISAGAGLAKQEMKNNADSRQIYEAADANLKQQAQEVANTAQSQQPNIIPTPQPYPQTALQLPNPSVLSQNMKDAEPSPTSA